MAAVCCASMSRWAMRPAEPRHLAPAPRAGPALARAGDGGAPAARGRRRRAREEAGDHVALGDPAVLAGAARAGAGVEPALLASACAAAGTGASSAAPLRPRLAAGWRPARAALAAGAGDRRRRGAGRRASRRRGERPAGAPAWPRPPRSCRAPRRPRPSAPSGDGDLAEHAGGRRGDLDGRPCRSPARTAARRRRRCRPPA